ncbi:hypothetical protein APHAL10511_004396 [Amanita phalloides]|nr:hypothetical protein APHAL10511_004396 [Amanita phalloides]
MFPIRHLRKIAQVLDRRAPKSTKAGMNRRAARPPPADCIVPRVYLTNYPTAIDAERLTWLAATHVVSVLDQDVDLPKFIRNEHRLHIRITDTLEADLLPHLDKATSFIHAALEENSTNVVVVHCMMGISRSPAVVCAYLIAQKNMEVEEAIVYVQSKRSIVHINPAFINQLESFASKHGSLVAVQEGVVLEMV